MIEAVLATTAHSDAVSSSLEKQECRPADAVFENESSRSKSAALELTF
jgi:hypothetical protein